MTELTNQKLKIENVHIFVKRKILQKDQLRSYEAEDVNKNCLYLLNVYTVSNDSSYERSKCLQELLLYRKISHKNIVKLKAFKEEIINNLTCFFFLIEAYDYISLSDILRKNQLCMDKHSNLLQEMQIWNIMYDVVQALNYLHYHKYIHRGVQLENIGYCNDGSYKLLDLKLMISTQLNKSSSLGGSNGNNLIHQNFNGFNKSASQEIDKWNLPINSSSSQKVEEVLSISANIQQEYRCPEYFSIFTSNITDKVDIYSLGICLFTLMFNHNPFNSLSSYNNTLNEVMARKKDNKYSCSLLEMVSKMLCPHSEERISAVQIMDFIESKITNGDINFFRKRGIQDLKLNLQFDINNQYLLESVYNKLISLAMGYNYRNANSIRYLLLKMTDVSTPISNEERLFYLKNLVVRCWNEREKLLNKLIYGIISLPMCYKSQQALITLFCISHFIFLSPNLLNKNSLLTDYLEFLSNLWKKRASINFYDRSDTICNERVSNYISTFSDKLRSKLKYFTKYTFLECNYTINATILNSIDPTSLIEKGFINETLNIYSNLTHKFGQVPLNVSTSLTEPLDFCLQTLNEQLVSLSKFLFIILFAYKNYYSVEKNKINIYDNRYQETTSKIKDTIELHKKNRKSCNSKYSFFEVQDAFIDTLRAVSDRLKLLPNTNFNIKQYFADSKSFCGISLHYPVSKIIESKGFENYEFKKTEPSPFRNKPERKQLQQINHNDVSSLLNNINPKTPHSFKNTQNSIGSFAPQHKPESSSDIFKEMDESIKMIGKPIDNLLDNSNADDNFFVLGFNKPHPNTSKNQTTSFFKDSSTYLHTPSKLAANESIYNKEIKNDDFDFIAKEMSSLFLSKCHNISKQIDLREMRNHSLQIPQTPSLYNQTKNPILAVVSEKSLQPRQPNHKILNDNNFSNNRHDSKTQINPEELLNKSLCNMINSSNTDMFQTLHNNNSSLYSEKDTSPNPNINKSHFMNDDNLLFNIFNAPPKVDKLPTTKDSNISEQINSSNQPGNINIYNISNDFNNINFIKNINPSSSSTLSPINLGTMAFTFIQKEAHKRANYIINSNDIQVGKQIGFGGTSEVFKGIYRGSEVAVKKLRIMDLKDEKIKEFKREVCSLTMMRHPYLVLFMGAM